MPNISNNNSILIHFEIKDDVLIRIVALHWLTSPLVGDQIPQQLLFSRNSSSPLTKILPHGNG